MGRGRFSKVVSVLVTGIIAMSGLPCKVLADVINAPTYYSVQSGLEYEITTNVTSSWINHTSVDFVVSNTGDETIHNWYLTFNTSYVIDNIWNGALYETDGNGTYTITSNGWNQDIRPGETVTIGATFSSTEEEALTIAPEWYLLNTEATIVDSSLYTLDYIEYSSWESGFTGQLTLQPQVDCQHWSLTFTSNRDITAVSSAVLNTEDNCSCEITRDENNMRLFANNAYNFGIQGVNSEDPLEFTDVELTVVDLAYHLTIDEDGNGIPDYLDFIGGGSIVGPTPTPTDAPTVSPTETPTEEPTETPSATPTAEPSITEEPTEAPTNEPTETITPTEEPTPTPVVDYELDRDLDGLPDYIEDQIGTDPLKADTDDDELSDYIEIMIGYDPTNPDTDGNGISDGDEDFDNDGLSNLQEIQLGTELCFDDSDGDHLIDGDEINVYGTNPLVPDSDGDGIYDGDEVSIGKNPSDGSDGATRISQTFTQSIDNAEDRAITSVDVTLSVANKIDRVLDVNDYYNVDVYSTGVYGRIGSPLNFECDEDFDTANVVIHYDETALGDALEENLGVLWFDEETGFYITQEQAVVDTTNNTVTLVLEHFSTYVLVNLSKWNNPPITPIEPLSLSGSVRTVRYETIGVYYDAFPIYEQNEAGEWVDTGRFYGGTIAPERNERNARNQYLSSNPNDVIIETISVGHYILFGGLRYTYTWLVTTNGYEDNDQDGVPDTLEINGVYACGQDELYTSRVDEGGYDSDGDTVSDLEEYRAIYIISKSSEDGSISVTRVSTNGQEILESDSVFYELAVSYVDSILNPGETFAFCTPKSNPNNPDSDEDTYNDNFDLKPLIEAKNASDYIQVSDLNSYDSNIQDFFESNSIDMNDSYAQREPNEADRALELYCIGLAHTFSNTMPNASQALNHFLDGSGDLLNINMYQLIAVPNGMGLLNYMETIRTCYAGRDIYNTVLQTCSYTATAYYYSNLSHLLEHAESVLKDGETITIMRTSQPYSFSVNGFPQALELNWECTLGVGGSWAGITATVTRMGDDYIVEYRYYLYDAYDWSYEFPFTFGLPADSSMHTMLHMTGLAREYFIYGEFTNTFTIPRSQIDDLNVLMELIQ